MANFFLGFPVPRARIADMIATEAPPAMHHTQHEKGGKDEISLEGLTPSIHHTRHEKGGPDEISLTGLTPDIHHTRHEKGGPDEIDCTGLKGAGGAAFPYSGTYLQLLFESLDGYEQVKMGTGEVFLLPSEVLVRTGINAWSQAGLIKRGKWVAPGFTWNKKSYFRTKIRFVAEDCEYGEWWVIVGGLDTGKYYGFNVRFGWLSGAVGDGEDSAEQGILQLGPGPFDKTHTLEAKFTPGVKVEFFVDGNYKTQITTYLPSGEEDDPSFFTLDVKNLWYGWNKEIHLSQWLYHQEP